MTGRELMQRTLSFKNPDRVPRDLWTLKWAELYCHDELAAIRRDFPGDMASAPAHYSRVSALEQGDASMPGEYIDPWGCRFTNIQAGVIGEVKHPRIQSDDWSDAAAVLTPEEWLSFDPEGVNAFCRESDRFVTGGACPRPFEQLQFLRGSQNLYMDLADPPTKMLDFMARMHDFYCRLLEKWAETDVDGLNFMDDWGAQKALLISPSMWDALFAPMYRDYIDIAHRHGKRIFMHSDGNTLSIIPRLIDMGLDAINTQIFCIGVENLRPYRGKITFWGEIDRQHLLPHGTLDDIDRAVDSVRDTLYADGGVIAQCEFGPGANPANVRRVFERWASPRRNP